MKRYSKITDGAFAPSVICLAKMLHESGSFAKKFTHRATVDAVL